jgi:hypothetical protein
MLVATIKFDQNCDTWTNEDYRNQFLLNTHTQYISEILRFRGYLYLNTIYECIGAKWNPEWKNICLLAELGELTYEIERDEKNEEYLIKIYQ